MTTMKRRKVKLYKNRAWLFEMYYGQKLTVQEIAEEAGVSYQTIYEALKSFDLIKNPRKWAKDD